MSVFSNSSLSLFSPLTSPVVEHSLAFKEHSLEVQKDGKIPYILSIETDNDNENGNDNLFDKNVTVRKERSVTKEDSLRGINPLIAKKENSIKNLKENGVTVGKKNLTFSSAENGIIGELERKRGGERGSEKGVERGGAVNFNNMSDDYIDSGGDSDFDIYTESQSQSDTESEENETGDEDISNVNSDEGSETGEEGDNDKDGENGNTTEEGSFPNILFSQTEILGLRLMFSLFDR